MNANDQFYARDAQVDAAAVAPLPSSRKIHVAGSRPDIRVPMREIAQTDTGASFGAEKNPSIVVYDTSGPYTDPAAQIDIRRGLPAVRAPWIAERGDTVEQDGSSSGYGRARLAGPTLSGKRIAIRSHRLLSVRIGSLLLPYNALLPIDCCDSKSACHATIATLRARPRQAATIRTHPPDERPAQGLLQAPATMSEVTLAMQRAMQKANAAYERRDWAEAARLCRAVLETQPTTFDALHLLGIIAAQESRWQESAQLLGRAAAARPDNASAHANLGNVLSRLKRFDEAIASYDRALKIRPKDATVHSNRGVALKALAQFDAAVASFDQAITLKPGFAEAYSNRGNALQELKRNDAAVASYERAIALKPDFAEAFCNRGNALQELGQLGAAVASYERAIALKPDYAEAYCKRGNALQALEQHEEAVVSYARAIALKPDFAEAYGNRGVALQALKRHEAAVASYDRAVALKPDWAEAHSNRGNALHDLGQHAAAVASYEQAIALKPDFAEVHYNRGIALEALRQLDAAVESYDRAIGINPHYADAHWNKSLALLLGGEFKNGWKLHEWRWRTDFLKMSTRGFAQPLWLGEEPIAGKTILLHSEQGMGDTIQFCRYARLVTDLGARVILEVPMPLLSLFTTLDGISRLVAEGSVLPPFDCHCPLMSLPLALKTEVSSIPAPIGYLRSDPEKFGRWQERLGGKNKLRVGLVWSGGHRRFRPELWDLNERRNISLAKLAPLRNERIEYYSLQKGEPAESDLARMKGLAWNGPEMVDYTSELHDFSETAALIDNLDLVISVDTSIAHLAGALGKPVWILNRFDTCWRWLLDRDDSPWYPTVRLYRQERAGDWEGVVERVRVDLERLSP